MNDKFVPESVMKRLTVGARVRYVPVDDDDGLPQPHSPASRYGANCHEAQTFAEGESGTITALDNRLLPGRPFLIRMDEPYQFGGRSFDDIFVAAHEIALVED